jgi:hypothetical protein
MSLTIEPFNDATDDPEGNLRRGYDKAVEVARTLTGLLPDVAFTVHAPDETKYLFENWLTWYQGPTPATVNDAWHNAPAGTFHRLLRLTDKNGKWYLTYMGKECARVARRVPPEMAAALALHLLRAQQSAADLRMLLPVATIPAGLDPARDDVAVRLLLDTAQAQPAGTLVERISAAAAEIGTATLLELGTLVAAQPAR